MTPQELKNSILQLAIQGRLVPQRPEEGTAEELYRQIQREKAALVKAGKIKKEKPLPEITEEEVPFEIPGGWFWIRLGDALIIERGGSPRPIKDYITDDPNGINWIKIGDTEKGGKYINSTKEKIITAGISKTRIVHKGDFLLSNSMSFGRPYILNIDGAIHDGWLVLRPIIDFFDKDYLYYLLSSPMVYSQFCSRVAGAVVNNLNSDKVALTVVPVPPLAEQKRIVAKIEELLPYIDRYEKAWSRLEDFNKRFPTDMQKSILQLAIQGKLVPQRPEEGTGETLYQQIQAEKQSLICSGKLKKEKPLPEITPDEIPFDIPASWKWASFLSVVDIATNLVQPADYQDYMHIAPDNIEKGNGYLLECRTVEQDKVASANHLFRKGQVLYSKIRPLLRKAVIAPFDGLCSADMYPLDTQLDVHYLLHYILSDAFNLQIATAMSSRVKMPKINQDELSKVLIPIPPLAEQKRIVAKLEELLPLCERLK